MIFGIDVMRGVPRTFVLGSLVGVQLLAGVAARKEPLWIGFAFTGLYLAQLLLLGFWAVIGEGSIWRRLLIIGAGTLAVWFWVARVADAWTFLIFFFAVVAAGAGVALVMRHGRPKVARIAHLQVTTSELFVLVAVVAIVVWARDSVAEDGRVLLENAVAAAMAAWVAFQDGRYSRRLLVAILALSWQTGVYAVEFGIDAKSGWDFELILNTARTTVLVSSFWVLKRCGYSLWGTSHARQPAEIPGNMTGPIAE